MYIDFLNSHDWPDADCVSILRNTMQAMGRKVTSASGANSSILTVFFQSKILIVEVISIPSTISTVKDSDHKAITLDELRSVKEYRQITPPNYIPANFGSNAKMSQALGIHMWGVFNAKERYFVSIFLTKCSRVRCALF